MKTTLKKMTEQLHGLRTMCPNKHIPNGKAVTALLPLFEEKAADPAMVKHGMDVIRKAVDMLNPEQVPVMAVDQPLFTIAKTVQSKWLDAYGEQAYVIMLGG